MPRLESPLRLRAFLRGSRPEEARALFGPITRFFCEGDSPDVVLSYSLDGAIVERQEHVQTGFAVAEALPTPVEPASGAVEPPGRSRGPRRALVIRDAQIHLLNRALEEDYFGPFDSPPAPITRAQSAALDAAEEQSLVARLARRVRRLYPEVTADVDPIERTTRVRRGLERARRFGLRDEAALFQFVDLQFAVGADFYEFPSIKSALTDTGGSADTRFSSALGALDDAKWKDVRGFCNPNAWQRTLP